MVTLRILLFHVCHAVLSVPCSLVVTFWERADLFGLFYVMFACVFVTFPYGVMGHVWFLIESVPDLCLLPYFGTYSKCTKTSLNWLLDITIRSEYYSKHSLASTLCVLAILRICCSMMR